MGGSNSKQGEGEGSGGSTAKKDSRGQKFLQDIKSNVEGEIARRAMMQREIQMAINIAKARDTLAIFGSAWATLVVGVGSAKAMGRAVPPTAGIPIVLGGLVLGNLADMAYGNKLNRVVKEAEYILDNERGRLVPFRQAPFYDLYTAQEKAAYYDSSTAVGDLWPNKLFASRAPKE